MLALLLCLLVRFWWCCYKKENHQINEFKCCGVDKIRTMVVCRTMSVMPTYDATRGGYYAIVTLNPKPL